MKQKFDRLDTAVREVMFLKTEIECDTEELVFGKNLSEEEKIKIANRINGRLYQLEILVRILAHKGKIYRDTCNQRDKGS